MRGCGNISLFFEGNTIRLHRSFFWGPIENNKNNDFLNIDFANTSIKKLDNLIRFYEENKDSDVYFVSDENESYPMLNFNNLSLHNQKIYLYTKLILKKTEVLLLRFGTKCHMKAWINSDCVLNTYIHGSDSYFVIYRFDKLVNNIIIELDNYSDVYEKNIAPLATLRISDFEKSLNDSLFRDYINKYVIKSFDIVIPKLDYIKEKEVEFLILPQDFCNLSMNDEIIVEVFDINCNLKDSFITHFGERIKYNLYFLYIQNSPTIKFRFTLNKTCNKTKYKEITISINKIDFLVKKLEKEFYAIKHMNSDIFHNIKGRIEVIKNRNIYQRETRPIEFGNVEDYISFYEEVIQLIALAKKEKEYIDYLQQCNYTTFFYQSYLDEQYEIVNICLPKHFNFSKNYPIIVHMSLGRYSWLSKRMVEDDRRDCIVVDVSCRGFTMGSYIGEKAFWESYNIIRKLLPIDDNRVYIIGLSNGAFSGWSIVQSCPHKFAAMVTACGVPNFEYLQNLSNLHIFWISANCDIYNNAGYIKARQQLNSICKSYEEMVVPEADDNTLSYINQSRYLIDWLLSKRLDNYPKKVYAVTENLRHNRFYWVEIAQCIEFKKLTKVCAEYMDEDTLQIETENVKILGLYFKENQKYPLHIHINGHSYVICLKMPKLYINIITQNIVKNLPGYTSNINFVGIADVFFDKVKVVLPELIKDKQKKIYEIAAQKFSKPQTYGWDKNICIQFPIIYANMLNVNNITECNYIFLLDNKKKYPFFELQKSLKISFEDNFFIYNNRIYQGKYCILFIQDNPYNIRKKLVFLQTNDINLYYSSIFVRKVALPTYLHGYKAIYNNVAVIALEQKYYKIRFWGQDIEKLV